MTEEIYESARRIKLDIGLYQAQIDNHQACVNDLMQNQTEPAKNASWFLQSMIEELKKRIQELEKEFKAL